MIGELTNHLWQSTMFAVVAGLLTLLFRRNRAAIRYGLWFAASIKFFLPFSLLIALGGKYNSWAPVEKAAAAPAVSLMVGQIIQPFPVALPLQPSEPGTPVNWLPLAILGTWMCGFAAVGVMRSRDWQRIRAAVRSSTSTDIPATVAVRSSPGLLEPGVVGLFRPMLLLPEGIAEHLTPPQLQAVLTHELCHVRRRDNLTSAVHMIVEAVFWFHPLVWWIGARLMEERERACDEAVLSQGSEPQDYAAGILSVCRNYTQSPLSCVSGVTGSDLKKRLHAILRGDIPGNLNFAKKLALAVVGITAALAPILAGMAAPAFKSASITSCEVFRNREMASLSTGSYHSGCTTLQRFIQQAYGLYANGHQNPLSSVTVTGGPSWINSDLYKIDAEAGGKQSQALMNGPMLQTLLEDKFKLKLQRQAREVPVYTLTVAAGGPKLRPFQGTCIPWDADDPPVHRDPQQMCGRAQLTSNGLDLNAATMTDLCMFFLVFLDRPISDKTGITGRFDFHLDIPSELLQHERRRAHVLQALSDPAVPKPVSDTNLVDAMKTAINKLGLKLEPAKGPGEFLVIDHAVKPAGN